MARDARKRNYIANVLQSGDEHHEAFEAQTKASVRHGAVTAKIGVPPDVLRLQATLLAASRRQIQ